MLKTIVTAVIAAAICGPAFADNRDNVAPDNIFRDLVPRVRPPDAPPVSPRPYGPRPHETAEVPFPTPPGIDCFVVHYQPAADSFLRPEDPRVRTITGPFDRGRRTLLDNDRKAGYITLTRCWQQGT